MPGEGWGWGQAGYIKQVANMTGWRDRPAVASASRDWGLERGTSGTSGGHGQDERHETGVERGTSGTRAGAKGKGWRIGCEPNGGGAFFELLVEELKFKSFAS